MTRQSFIAELSKLIVFMDEGDRKDTLDVYEKLFELADENKVLSRLVSPTRQAVNIARTYDSESRKEEIKLGKADKADFLIKIEKICKDILDNVGPKTEESIKPTVTELEETAAEETAAEEKPQETVKAVFEEKVKAVFDEKEDEGEDEVQSPLSSELPPSKVESQIREICDAVLSVADENSAPLGADEVKIEPKVTAAVAALARAVNDACDDNDISLDEIIEKTRDIYEDEPVRATSSAVVSENETGKYNYEKIEKEFFSLADVNLAQEDTAVSQESETAEYEMTPVADEVSAFLDSIVFSDDITAAEEINTQSPESVAEEKEEKPDDQDSKKKKDTKEDDGTKRVKAGLLILYILIAVPVLAFAILLILGIAAALGFLAVATGRVALLAIGSAFGSYAVFADILVVIGLSLALLGIAVLLLWTAVWLIIGLAAGLVKKAIALAGKWCYKEAEA